MPRLPSALVGDDDRLRRLARPACVSHCDIVSQKKNIVSISCSQTREMGLLFGPLVQTVSKMGSPLSVEEFSAYVAHNIADECLGLSLGLHVQYSHTRVRVANNVMA